ncbi:MAG TPA: competence/damage-inducible protein A [Spirochaetia bacterium]|nr:MAG: competence/damage-inducible protein A [Spirochaetes bacterium GWB1_36_13]HCL57658.1 competence/damage-inducible protein A [Spirochaetia bacterium]
MTAHLLSVGTELLLGEIINTNQAYLSSRMAEMGFSVFYHTTIGDNLPRLVKGIKEALKDADILMITGGLGPTQDDLTKESVAEALGEKLILFPEALKTIESFFQKIGRSMPPMNQKQAYFPEGVRILKNPAGTAPGCFIEKNSKKIFLLPGPPREMKKMFEEEVYPIIKKEQEFVIHSKILKVFGLGESKMAEEVSDLIDHSLNPTVAPYAKDFESHLRITAKASSIEEALKLIQPTEEEIKNRLGINIYGTDKDSLETVTAKILVEKKLSISTAESCTGGLVASKLIDFPGISAVFKNGFITYSNESKIKLLGVKEETIQKYGAVSCETVSEMAYKTALISGSDISIAVSGIAGPGGGSEEKPVGLVYLGLSFFGKIKVKELRLWGDRNHIRNRAALCALDWLRRELFDL